ncbi:MAG: acyltransferase family protein [Clostridia bacterium]|nr:acyltransferase family protein [Clostridia bacterium]
MEKQRNTCIELLRLFAALWVMYYHGYSLIERGSMFSNGRIAVDFFFLLSGFFFLKSAIKLDDKPFFKNLFTFIWKRFKPLAITFGICMIFVLIFYYQHYEGFLYVDPFGYLWFVPHLMIVLALYYVLRKLIKRNIVFNIVVAIISMLCFVALFIPLTDYGIFRGIASVGLGILISQIPKLEFSQAKLFSMLMYILLFLAITIVAIIAPAHTIQDPLCLLVLFPAILYFANQVEWGCKPLNLVCSVSFGLYAYQTVARVLEDNSIITSGSSLALIVIILAALDVCIKHLVKLLKKHPN